MRDPYEVLGVPRGSDKETIKKAYRKLARQWHPDMHPPDKQAAAAEKFKEVNAAFEALEKPEKVRGKPFGGPMDDFFSQFFGGEMPRQAPSGEHIVVECHITLLDVLRGGKRDLPYSRRQGCENCGGLGGVESACPHCQGTGAKIIHGAAMTVKAACHACQGTGKAIIEKCQHCEDGSTGVKEETISFDIPVGVENGMRFAFRGMGQPSRHPMGGPGNLYVVINIESHDKFEVLTGGNVLLELPLTYSQLVIGTEMNVETLEGDVVVKVPAGTSPGQKFRLREQGLPVFSNRTGGIYKRGDQLVEVQLKMPTDLSDEHRKAVEQLAQFELRS